MSILTEMKFDVCHSSAVCACIWGATPRGPQHQARINKCLSPLWFIRALVSSKVYFYCFRSEYTIVDMHQKRQEGNFEKKTNVRRGAEKRTVLTD